jgi:hypothetical protein
MFGARTAFPTNFFSSRSEFIEFKENTHDPEQSNVEMEPVMEDKKSIIDSREKLKSKKKEQRDTSIPGYKLLKKLHKKQQIEDSLTRVVKKLYI